VQSPQILKSLPSLPVEIDRQPARHKHAAEHE
jgi:hypothetical protein